jgi:hypothetical protein
MSGDRKLKLVPPVGNDEPLSLRDEPPFSARELAAAEELRALLERGDHEFVDVLRAAYEPADLDANENDALINRALGIGESDAPATSSEREAADRLREAIMHPHSEDRDEPQVEVLDALVAAHRPKGIDPLRNELLITRALKGSSQRTVQRRVVPVVTAAILGVAAMAAGISLYLQGNGTHSGTANVAAPALQRSRSTANLFDAATPFPRVGGESARMDRITKARATDLRNNRFALWGVR